jgi:UDP-glucose:(heptosyl)LPS alpha-1,3-glucosyltransferase
VKLAFCLFKYFPYGGLQRDFMRIAQECLRRGHDVDVFTMGWDGAQYPGLTVKLLTVAGWQNHTRAKYFAAQVRQQAQAYDLIVGFNKMPGLDVYYAADTCYQAKARAQRPTWYRLTPRYRQLVAAEAAVFSEKFTTEILLIAKAQQDEFVRYYGTQAERFHLLPPGIAPDRVAPNNASEIRQATRKSLSIQDDEFMLLAIGSGFKTKGLDRSLLSLAALPANLRAKAHLYIVGKDNPTIFQHQAKRLGIAERIHFLGGRDDVPQLLLAGDILLHPAYNENTGTVLLEALVAGLPVLTTDACGYAHYVLQAEAGRVLASPFQQADLNQALSSMLLAAERPQWRSNALAFAQTADIYSMPVRAVDLLESFQKGVMR